MRVNWAWAVAFFNYNEDASVAWEEGAAGREESKKEKMNQRSIHRYNNMGPTEKLQTKARRRELEADGSDLKAYTLAKNKLNNAMRFLALV